jgi:hypothetical protein
MAFRINSKFKDGTTSGPLTDIVAAEPPHYGDTIRVTRQGHDVTMLVTAIWTPKLNSAHPVAEALIMVEAREV